jgi:spore coat protein H
VGQRAVRPHAPRPRPRPPLRARYAAALTDVYSLDRVLDRVDELALEVLDSAHRDELLWASQYQTYGGWNWRDDFVDHDLEMLYLRQWIADRWAFVAALY